MNSKENQVVKVISSMDEYRPSEIVRRLDEHIIGHAQAKRLVAIAFRNRMRRRLVEESLREEISPKNILMIGPTGVGKTEIARRMSKILDAPFVKVEATKFTERGYVGRDVEHMIRSLINTAVTTVKSRLRDEKKTDVSPKVRTEIQKAVWKELTSNGEIKDFELDREEKKRIREQIYSQIEEGLYENLEITIHLKNKGVSVFPMADMFPGMEDMEGMQGIFGGEMGGGNKERRMTVREAREALTEQFAENDVDSDSAIEIAVKWAQEMGIVFIDEIDKVAGGGSGQGPDVSREGVQRDLLPMVEGTSVNTKYGVVKTDHILFIAAGAFHVSKPSDLIPELQGRFPLRVELDSLTIDDLEKILTQPKGSLLRQYTALLQTEGIRLKFHPAALRRIAELAYEVNSSLEDIGARRLHTMMEYLLEDISFDAPELQKGDREISKAYVEDRLSKFLGDHELSKYIL